MNYYDKVELLVNRMYSEIEDKISEISSHISKKRSFFKLEEESKEIEEIINMRVDSPKYELTDNGIKFLFFNENVYKLIKDFIPRSITKLSIPLSRLPSLQELSSFPMLKELIRNDFHGYTKQELDYIKKLGINNCQCQSTYMMVDNQTLSDSSTIAITGDENIVSYNKMTVTPTDNYPSNKEISYLKISLADINNMDNLKKLMEKDIIRRLAPYAHLEIENPNNNSIIKIELSDKKEIDSLKINNNDYAEIEKILSFIEENNYQVNEITVFLDNKTDKNLQTLEKFSKKLPIKINYGDVVETDYEGFASMRATIDWYKEIINKNDLSQAEKVLFAYDIIKSFQYNESKEDKNHSRYIPEIIKTGNIVCVGYSSFLKELLNELGIKADTFSVMTPNDNNQGELTGHRRNIIALDDDKYNIHGIFTLDATWDSKRKNLSLVRDEKKQRQVRFNPLKTDTIEKSYEDLSLYRHFLIPYSDYEILYPRDTKPGIYNDIITGKFETSQKEALLGKNISNEEAQNIIRNTKRPNLETFTKLLRNVREKEGYGTETISKTKESIEVNQMIDELYKTEKTFFQPSKKN